MGIASAILSEKGFLTPVLGWFIGWIALALTTLEHILNRQGWPRGTVNIFGFTKYLVLVFAVTLIPNSGRSQQLDLDVLSLNPIEVLSLYTARGMAIQNALIRLHPMPPMTMNPFETIRFQIESERNISKQTAKFKNQKINLVIDGVPIENVDYDFDNNFFIFCVPDSLINFSSNSLQANLVTNMAGLGDGIRINYPQFTKGFERCGLGDRRRITRYSSDGPITVGYTIGTISLRLSDLSWSEKFYNKRDSLSIRLTCQLSDVYSKNARDILTCDVVRFIIHTDDNELAVNLELTGSNQWMSLPWANARLPEQF